MSGELVLLFLAMCLFMTIGIVVVIVSLWEFIWHAPTWYHAVARGVIVFFTLIMTLLSFLIVGYLGYELLYLGGKIAFVYPGV